MALAWLGEQPTGGEPRISVQMEEVYQDRASLVRYV